MGIEFYRDASLPFFELKLCAEEEVHYKRHSHEECSLGILQQGETLVWCDGESRTLREETLLFFPPCAVHACAPLRKDRWRYAMFFVDAEWFRAFREAELAGTKIGFTLLSSRECDFSPVHRMLATFVGGAEPLEKETNATDVFRWIAGKNTAPSPRGAGREHPGLMKIQEHLRGFFPEKITLDRLEELSGINKFHIPRLFKERFMLTPHAYQTMLRVNHAKKELRKRKHPVELAAGLGFFDQSHFIKVFKSHVGVTPRQYRGEA